MSAEYRQNIFDHKTLVGKYIQMVIAELAKRAVEHDFSKFGHEEFDAYASALPRFQESEYGSEEYMACIESIKPAIEHHITHNRHHPEYWGELGVNGMSLIDLIEMVCDWIAASQRVPGGQLRLDIQRERFDIGPSLFGVIERTVEDLLG